MKTILVLIPAFRTRGAKMEIRNAQSQQQAVRYMPLSGIMFHRPCKGMTHTLLIIGFPLQHANAKKELQATRHPIFPPTLIQQSQPHHSNHSPASTSSSTAPNSYPTPPSQHPESSPPTTPYFPTPNSNEDYAAA